MNSQLLNCLKFDEPNPTKEDRKKYAKRKSRSSDEGSEDKIYLNKGTYKKQLKLKAGATKKVTSDILKRMKNKKHAQTTQNMNAVGLETDSLSDDDRMFISESPSRQERILTQEIAALKAKVTILEAENSTLQGQHMMNQQILQKI